MQKMDGEDLMDEFKDGQSLYDQRRKQGKIRNWEPHLPEAGKPTYTHRNMKRPKEPTQDICEYWELAGCKASREAVEQGLAKTIQPCSGRIPPVCSIRTRLTAGKTIKELFKK